MRKCETLSQLPVSNDTDVQNCEKTFSHCHFKHGGGRKYYNGIMTKPKHT